MSTIPSGIYPNSIGLSPTSFGQFPKPPAPPTMSGIDPAREFGKIVDAQLNGLRATVSEPMAATPGAQMDFGSLAKDFIMEVDAKGKASAAERRALLAGESTNLHQAMIASQEASVSFSLMVEMRNKLLETYQELMRLQI